MKLVKKVRVVNDELYLSAVIHHYHSHFKGLRLYIFTQDLPKVSHFEDQRCRQQEEVGFAKVLARGEDLSSSYQVLLNYC